MPRIDIVLLVIFALIIIGMLPPVGARTGFVYGGPWLGGWGTPSIGAVLLILLVLWVLGAFR